jgi:hypothetical protein
VLFLAIFFFYVEYKFKGKKYWIRLSLDLDHEFDKLSRNNWAIFFSDIAFSTNIIFLITFKFMF